MNKLDIFLDILTQKGGSFTPLETERSKRELNGRRLDSTTKKPQPLSTEDYFLDSHNSVQRAENKSMSKKFRNKLGFKRRRDNSNTTTTQINQREENSNV